MRFVVLSVTLVSSLALAACATSDHVTIGGGGSVPTTETPGTVPATIDAASFCQAMCHRVESCDASLDTQTCENQCTNTNAAVFPRLRSDVVDLIVSCFDGKDCKTVLGGGFVGACTADAVASVAPSAAASSFCEALSAAKKSCSGSEPPTKAACLDTAKLYGDLAIAQAQNCVKRSCTEVDECVSAVFGSLGASTPTPKPAGSCSGKFSDLGSCESCAETSCCSETTSCYADSDCRNIVRTCFAAGTSSSSCSQAYTQAPSSSQSLAGTVFNCASSSCSSSTSTCRFGG